MGYFNNEKVCNGVIDNTDQVNNINNDDDLNIRDVWSYHNIMDQLHQQQRIENYENQVSLTLVFFILVLMD